MSPNLSGLVQNGNAHAHALVVEKSGGVIYSETKLGKRQMSRGAMAPPKHKIHKTTIIITRRKKTTMDEKSWKSFEGARPIAS